jgi:hypothetical protein
MDPNEILTALADLYRNKNKQHGDNLPKFGKVMAAMYPQGYPAITTAEDFERAHIFFLIVGKLTRFAGAATHDAAYESMTDMPVYCAMYLSLMERDNERRQEHSERDLYAVPKGRTRMEG